MRVNEIPLLLVFGISLVLGGWHAWTKDAWFVPAVYEEWVGFDAQLRRNEIRLAHQGVNSFRVWDREIQASGFVPLSRPDKVDVPAGPGDVKVHAYPPWHTAYFWFYGWMSRPLYLAVLFGLFGVSLSVIFCFTRNFLKVNSTAGNLLSIGAFAMLSLQFALCFRYLNYGVFVLAVSFLLFEAVDAKRPYVAGFLWAIMMIKPQMAVLFFWPLLFRRFYKTIVTAVLICLLATIWTSLACRESPVDLILQVPKIGAPYLTGFSNAVFSWFAALFGSRAYGLWSFVCFVGCGILCYLVRRSGSFMAASLPVVFFVPLWTYSQQHDHVILLIGYLFVFAKAFPNVSRGRLCWRIIAYTLVLCSTLCLAWDVCVSRRLFNPSGIGFAYRLGKLIFIMAGWSAFVLWMKESICLHSYGLDFQKTAR